MLRRFNIGIELYSLRAASINVQFLIFWPYSQYFQLLE